MQANSRLINYSTSICPFQSGKCGEEGKKLQKFEYLENEKIFFDEVKKKKIVDTSFNNKDTIEQPSWTLIIALILALNI